MKCTNCGAQVDDNSIFCPVCGNKLDKGQQNQGSDDKLIEKTTFTPTNANQNQINTKTSNSNHNSKIKGFFNSLGKKKNQNSNNNPSKQGANPNYNHINQKMDPPSTSDQIPPSYYGYDPVDDRKRKDLRHQQNYGSKANSQASSAYINDRLESQNQAKLNQSGIQDTNSKETYPKEGNLSAQARIASKIGQEKGYVKKESKDLEEKNISYDDIPKEFIEARIARKLYGPNNQAKKTPKEDYNDKAIHNGNIYGMLRSRQTGFAKDLEADKSYYKGSGDNDQRPDNRRPNPVKASSYEAMPSSNANEPTNNSGNNQSQSQSVGEAPKDNREKDPFKFKPIYLIPILIVLLGAGIAYMLSNKEPAQIEVDLSEYIDVAYNGDDGLATPQASLNTSKLLSDYGNEIAYKNKKRKSDEFSSPANQFVSELENSTSFQYSKDNDLSSGEEITVVANITDTSIMEDYNVLFTNTMKSVIVDNLITSENQNPFDFINVDFSGESPNISLIASLSEDAPDYMADIEIAPSKTSDLKAGEEVNVSLIYDEEEFFNSYGIRLEPTDKTFKAPGEPSDESSEQEEADDKASANLTDGYITSVDSLDEDLLGTMKYNAGELIKNTFADRSFTQIDQINYLGAITGSDANASDLKNRIMLVYEIKAKEDYEGKYTNDYTYYSFVEYQNVKDKKDGEGKFYKEGPITTDNEIFHKFFVEEDYTYYEIPYYGFAFLEEVITRINNALSGLDIDDSIAGDVAQYFEKSDGVAGEYQGNDTRLSLRSDGSLKYKTEQRVHQGTWKEEGSDVTLTIEGVNVDTPINAKFENDSLNVSEQGEMEGQSFNKMQAF